MKTDFIVDSASNVTPAFTPETPYILVSEFARAFSTSTSMDLWVGLVREEHVELVMAMAESIANENSETLANVLKEAADLLYVTTGFELVATAQGVSLSDEYFEELTECLSAVVEAFGVDALQTAFLRVHESNMSKLGDDGKPVYREDGKVLKGPNYKAPVLTDLTLRAA